MGPGVTFPRKTGRWRRQVQTALGVALSACALAACGSVKHFADDPKPATPVDLSVYVDNSHVSVSPAKVGAGPVILYITNQASGSVDLSITGTAGRSVAHSGSINSGQTYQLQTRLTTGRYAIGTGTKIPSAKLVIGKARANADNVLLQP